MRGIGDCGDQTDWDVDGTRFVRERERLESACAGIGVAAWPRLYRTKRESLTRRLFCVRAWRRCAGGERESGLRGRTDGRMPSALAGVMKLVNIADLNV
ncbi:DUF1176 domain-containing protein [Burkholderia sp. FERM BP-3421]|uniref:DUF1176 domain-containing protein n=1 Tax=Burkholderia sp. FERM BP-3421 TaxID=1494466 RepID=UPI003FCD8EB4